MDTSRLFVTVEGHADGLEEVEVKEGKGAGEDTEGESICFFNSSKSSVNSALMNL